MLSRGEASESDLATKRMRCITNAEVGPEEQRSQTRNRQSADIAFQVPN